MALRNLNEVDCSLGYRFLSNQKDLLRRSKEEESLVDPSLGAWRGFHVMASHTKGGYKVPYLGV